MRSGDVGRSGRWRVATLGALVDGEWRLGGLRRCRVATWALSSMPGGDVGGLRRCRVATLEAHVDARWRCWGLSSMPSGDLDRDRSCSAAQTAKIATKCIRLLPFQDYPD